MALSKTRQSPSMVLDGAIHGANGFGEGHPPPLDSFRAARTEGRNQRQKHKQKGSHRLPFLLLGSDPFAQQRALTPALTLLLLNPPPRGMLGGAGG